MKHLVITIGCEYGAKGNAIGRKIAQDLGIKTLFWQKYGYFVNSLNAGNFLPNVIDIAFTMCYNSVTLRAESDASGAAQKQEIML